MGEVYRALDTKLNREVAIKVLLPAVVNDPDRLARFRREAHVLAALNHPHIAAIYGLEDTGTRTALVLELVDGPTLADRIAYGAIPLDEALPIATQIAEALDAAHQQGIVHRDLKPANVKVRPDGTVKVLDFGLAKAIEPAGSSPERSQSPTITSPAMTQAGMILGTAAYMSPEQAKGRPQDKRSDLWAFGCVLFEMLAGRRLFDREDVSETLAAVLTADVPWQQLPPALPTGVRQALTVCLQRDPKQRLRDAGDLLLLLNGALDTAARDRDAVPTPRLRIWQHPALVVSLASALAISVVISGWAFRRDRHVNPRRPVRLSVAIPPTDRLDVISTSVAPVLALSPDGRTLVYAARRAERSQLYRRPLDQLSGTPIPGTEDAAAPFFSPDGEWIGFLSGNTIKKVPVLGGEAITLGSISGNGSASWSGDTIVFGRLAYGPTLGRLAASGSDVTPITKLQGGDVAHFMPEMLPGGRSVLFSSIPDSKIHLISLDGTQDKTLVEGLWPRYSPSGHLLFLRDTSLWVAPFDPDRAELTGPAVRVLEGVLGPPAISADGTLAYLSGVPPRIQLVWVDRQGGETPVDVDPADFFDVDISPDGRRLAVSRGTAFTTTDIWVYDLERKTSNKLTTDLGLSVFPLWTRDGQALVYSATREGHRNLFRRSADGSGTVQRLTTSAYQQSPWDWSLDGTTIVLQELREQTGWDIARIPLDGGADSVLVDTPRNQLSPALSPDGRWIAYSSSESGTSQVEVRPFPNVKDRRWQISSRGGTYPKWSPDGRELFYLDGAGVMRVAIATEPEFRPAIPERLFAWTNRGTGEKNWDVAPDGRFLMKKVLPAEYTVNVVLNWVDELKARVPSSR
jgi:serine/threonine-protein kinase